MHFVQAHNCFPTSQFEDMSDCDCIFMKKEYIGWSQNSWAVYLSTIVCSKVPAVLPLKSLGVASEKE